ncbi:MAG: TRAP transporter small permease [Synergistales bacterium]|nr:TRAP transporter small permease [Synergistales bacterium]
MKAFFDHFEEYALLVLFPAMVAVVFTATLARYLNLFQMFWGEELARYIMVYMAYIGAGLGMKRGAHIGVSFIVTRFKSPAVRKCFHFIRLLVILFFCSVIILFMKRIIGSQVNMGQTTPALFIPMWIPYAAVPFGMVLIGIRAIQAFFITSREMSALEETRES